MTKGTLDRKRTPDNILDREVNLRERVGILERLIGAAGQGGVVIGGAGVTSVTAGLALIGGGTGAVTLDLNLAVPSGLIITADALAIDDTIAGAGLTITAKVLAVGQGDGLTVSADLVSLTTPGSITSTSLNSSVGNHTHAIDGTILTTAANVIAGTGLTSTGTLPSGITINLTGASPSGLTIAADSVAIADSIAGAGLTITSKVLAVGQGDGLTVTADLVALTTPGSITSTSTNTSVGNHTHAIDSTILTTAANVIAGAGLTSTGTLATGITINLTGASPSGLAITADSVAIDDSIAGIGLYITSKVLNVGVSSAFTTTADAIGLAVPGSVSVSSANVETGNHTHAVITSNAITTATAVITATNASGYLQLLRLGAGIAPTVPLHASSAINGSALQVEAASLTTAAAVSIQNIPLSTDGNSGRAVEIKASGEGFSRMMIFSDGKIGTGPGSGGRDTYLSRTAANTWLISSDGSTGQGNLQVNDNAWVGLGSAAGRFIFDNLADDIIYIRDANLHFHDGVQDRLIIRRSGDSTNVEADILAQSALGLAGEVEVVCFIDSNNDSSTAYFGVAKDAENITAATELFRVTETGFMGLMDTSNTFMTVGLTINQGAADNEILNFKSSDIAHGVTTWAETDSYAFMQKHVATTGGLDVWGLSEDLTGIRLVGVATNGDTTKSTAAVAPIRLQANKKSGTSVGVMGTNENLAVVSDSGGAKFIIDKEGDTHRDGTDNTYDAYDDAHLARAFDLVMSPAGVIRSEFDQFLKYGRDDLIAAGILHPSGFYNESQLLRLVVGSSWQGYTHRQQLEQRIAILEEMLHKGDSDA